MRFFSALLALPLIGAVLGKPVPVKQEEKRLLGLDNFLGSGSSSGLGSAGTTDLAGLLDQMNADLGPSFDILYGVRGEDANVVEGVLGNIKGTLEVVLDTIKNDAPGGQTASPDEIAGKLKPFLENMSESLDGLPTEVTDVPVIGDLIGALEAYAGSLVVLLKWFFGEQLKDALKGAVPALSGTVGGVLSNLLSLGAA